ncbi:MAG: phage holin family protein [Gallionellaceae bacterium]
MSPETGDSGKNGGLFNSMRTTASTLLAIVQTRVELLSTELEEERIRLTSMLMWMLLMLFCTGMGVIFFTLLLVLALWDDHRLLAVGIPAVLFSLGAVLAWQVVAGKARSKPRLFAASLTELSRDRDQLTP